MGNKFEIRCTRPAQKLVLAISRKKRGLELADIKSMLGYNILTIKQLSELTGEREDRISVLSLDNPNPRAHKNKCKLSRVYPFRSSERTGPVFILRDEQCDQFILECNK